MAAGAEFASVASDAKTQADDPSSSAACRTFSSSRPMATIFAPAAMHALGVESPSPLAPPMITITRSDNAPLDIRLTLRHRLRRFQRREIGGIEIGGDPEGSIDAARGGDS